MDDPGTIYSIIGAFFSIIAGMTAWRQICRFATVDSGGYIIWSFLPAFLITISLFLFLRLDYNRYIFFTSMVMTLVWFLIVHLWSKRVERRSFAIIPGGKARSITSIGNADYLTLKQPVFPAEQLDGVIADLRHRHKPEWELFIADLTLAGIPVYHFKNIEENLTGQVSVENLSENSFGLVLPDLAYLRIKLLIDLIIVILLLPIGLPVLIITTIVIRIADGRQVLFRQKRMGYRGKPFTVYKFRTMQRDNGSSKNSTDDAMTKENDSRVTRVGAVLRKYRIDELPQVYNIMRGEMSWIGPRPEAMELSKLYEARLPYYRYRHAVRPGISGWAQVKQGHVTAVEDIHEKLKYDFYYIKHVSVWLDFLITLKTLRTVLFGIGHK